MSRFPVHTIDSAPPAARGSLEGAQQAFGFVPNLLGVLAAAPSALAAYLRVSTALRVSSLSAIEQQVVLLAVSAEHECEYCMSAHSAIAASVEMPPEVLDALRHGQPLPDARLETLRQTTEAMVKARGWLTQDQVDQFLAAGFTPPQLLEVIVGVAQKTISNYTNHLAATPLDPQFAAFEWRRDAPVSTR